ncbi:MAG: hypothetical protein COB85_06745 [Bacteroidetes bacterium]|nr:MAG: hypothetical protein COB85_06745 [Bacteroidota bacterium]
MKNLLTISLFIVLYGNSVAADQTQIDSLQNLLNTDIADSTMVMTLNTLGWAIMYNNPDTAIILSTHAIAIAKKIEWPTGIAASSRHLGAYYYLKAAYHVSLQYYFKALEINEQLNDRKGISSTLGNIGIVYDNQGDYPRSLEYYFKALQIGEELKDKSRIAVHLGNIGIVYRKQGDYSNALEYYFKALEIVEELEDKRGIAIQLGNIGIIYHRQDDYPEALAYYLKALEMSEELENVSYIALNLSNIGLVYQDQGESSSDPKISARLGVRALEYYFKALKMSRELGSNNYIASNLGNIGILYTRTGKYKEAESYLDSSLKLCDSIGALNELGEFELAASILYDTTAYLAFQGGDYKEAATRYKKALEHHIKSGIAKDTLFNEEKSKDIGRLEQRHEIEMGEMSRLQTEAEKTRLQSKRIERRDILQYSGILIGILFLFGSVLLLGRLSIPVSIAEGIVFILFLIIFEFLLVLTDPFVGSWTNDAPAWKLLVNAGLAIIIFPVHSFFEGILKSRLFKDGDSSENGAGLGKSAFIFLLAALSIANLSFGNKTDSLKHELVNTELNDTTRIVVLNHLSRQLLFSNPDTAHALSSEALEISQSIDNPKNVGSSFISIANTFWIRGDYPQALTYYNEALEIFKKLENKEGIAGSLSGIGLINRNQGNYSAALKYYNESLIINREIGNMNGVSRDLGNIGVVYRNLGNYPAALKSYFENLEIAKETGNERYQAIAHGNIGNVYHNQGDFEAALRYYTQALSMGRKLGDKQRVAIQLGNMGIIYHKQGKYADALQNYFEALKIERELGRQATIAISLGNIGTVYANQAEMEKDLNESNRLIEKALQHYIEALKINRNSGNKKGVSVDLGNLGTVFTKIGQFEIAEKYLDSALAIDTSIGALHHSMEDYDRLSIVNDSIAQAAFQSGEYKEAAFRYQSALEFKKIHGTTKDSLFNEDRSKDIGRLEQRHEFELDDLNRRQKAEEELRLMREKLARRDVLQYSGILIGIILMFGLVLLLVRVNIPARVIEGAVFISFLIVFEFLLVLTDPYVDVWTNDAPAWKLLINAGFAGVIFPLHQFFENKLKLKIVST